jgi:hypothetical protein
MLEPHHLADLVQQLQFRIGGDELETHLPVGSPRVRSWGLTARIRPHTILLMKLGIHSQFVHYYLLSRKVFHVNK